MEIITLLFRHAWILFIAATVGNALFIRHRSKDLIAEDPGLAEGYQQIFKAILFYGNMPWVIMAVGMLSGLTNNVFDYFRPRDMNPAVLAFHAAVIILWVLFTRWIYLKGGAAFLERHPGVLVKRGFGSVTYLTAKEIKMFVPLMLLGGIAGVLMMWLVNIPAPKL